MLTVSISWDGADNFVSNSLSLPGQCRDEILLFIAFGLHNNNILIHLDISKNGSYMSYDAVRAIRDCLKSNTVLKQLDMSYNSIAAKNFEIISESLQMNKTLHTFDISHNNIFDSGAKAIGDLLEGNDSLQVFNVILKLMEQNKLQLLL